MLPAIRDPHEWRVESNTVLVALHLLSGMKLDVSRSDLEDDVIGALRSSFEVDFEWANSVTSGCELHGTYNANPPRIRVSRGQGTARSNFTAAHELGHHLQANDTEWALGVLAELRRHRSFIARDIEERVSDQVAVRILMPDDFVEAAWAGELTPVLVRRLTRDGRVSRWAASIRAIGRARLDNDDPTVVVIARPDGVVTSAVASHGDRLAPPPHRTIQPDFATLAERPVGRHRAIEGFLYSSGVSRADLTYEWCWDDDGSHVIVVARPEYRFGDVNWSGDDTECLSESCDTTFSRSQVELCTACNTPICPDCGTHGCEQKRGVMCMDCFTEMSLAESQRGDRHEVCPI